MIEYMKQMSELCSLSLDAAKLEETSTIVISCRDLKDVAHASLLKQFGDFALLQADNVEQSLSHPESSLVQLLSSLLKICFNLERIILCAHSSCGDPVVSSISSCKDRMAVGSHFHTSVCETSSNLSSAEVFHAQEASIVSSLHALEKLFNNNMLPYRRLKLHGWLYEPELDWVSVFDQEMGFFVPLSAHSPVDESINPH